MKRRATRVIVLSALALALLAGPAFARSVTNWYTPTMNVANFIDYGATVDLTCAGHSCTHHLSLERDGGLGWVTVAHSVVPEGNGQYRVACDIHGTHKYKSHFHTKTYPLDGTAPFIATNDSSARSIHCVEVPEPIDPIEVIREITGT